MSQYYVLSRPQTHRRHATTSPPICDDNEEEDHHPQALLPPTDVDNSIYIFPNPSTSNNQPSSLSSSIAGSAPSTSHDLYHHHQPSSFTSRARSSESSRPRSEQSYVSVPHSGLSTGTDTPSSIEVWDWSPDLEEADVEAEEAALSEGVVVEVEAEPRPAVNWRSHRWDVVRIPLRPTRLQDSHHYRPLHRTPVRLELAYVRSRTHSRATTTTTTISTPTGYRSSSIEQQNANNPHPRVRIPLLSTIASLFSVDESTLHLLTHSTSHRGSVLFPGHVLPAGDSQQSELNTALDDEDQAESVHGLHKLWISSDISSESWRSLKRGFAVVCTTSPVPSIGIVKLWGLVNQVWINGERAVKEVWGGTVG